MRRVLASPVGVFWPALGIILTDTAPLTAINSVFYPQPSHFPGWATPPIGLGKYFRVAKSFPISRLVIRLIVGEGIQREGDSMLLVLEHPDDAWVELMKDLPVRVGCEDPSEVEQLEESVQVGLFAGEGATLIDSKPRADHRSFPSPSA